MTLSGANSYTGLSTINGGLFFLGENKSRFFSDSRSTVDDLGWIDGSGSAGDKPLAPMASPVESPVEFGLDMADKEKLAGDVNGDFVEPRESEESARTKLERLSGPNGSRGRAGCHHTTVLVVAHRRQTNAPGLQRHRDGCTSARVGAAFWRESKRLARVWPARLQEQQRGR